MIDKIIKILEKNTEITRCYEDGECYEMIPDGNFKETADELNDLFALHVVGVPTGEQFSLADMEDSWNDGVDTEACNPIRTFNDFISQR